ncbi:MAG: NAD(P)/FAD-dependent oxidoreductase [Solirubrobacteraceae bacterium]
MREIDHLLIGGGIASATCARTLREAGAGGSVLVVGREPGAPYHRPPISKGYLRGDQTREDALVHPDGWWEENGVELLTRSSVMSLDPGERIARLQSKEEIRFKTALLATGAMVRRLSVEGAGLEGIHYLRALGNADSLRRDLAESGAERVVCVGGSYIACEVAASLTELGHACTLVMQEETTLERGFGSRAGRFFQARLEERGVEVIGSDEVERFDGDADGDGERVQRVVTRGGRVVDADAVVVGVGATPDVTLARRAGLDIGELGGVAASASLETSAPGIYAAGDMCEYDSVVHGRHVRIEHEDVAVRQGATAARSMLGHGEPHRDVPYFFADLADWTSLEYVGPALTWDEEIVRGSLDEGAFSVFYLEAGRVRGTLSVGRPGDLDEGRRLIAAGAALTSSESGALGSV